MMTEELRNRYQRYFADTLMGFKDLEHKGNNKLFHAKTSKREFLLKHYSDRVPFSVSDIGDWTRCSREYQAIEHMRANGICDVPEPISFFPKDNVAVYSYEPGRIKKASEASGVDVMLLTDFLVRLDDLGKTSPDFPPAHCACFSPIDYLRVIHNRFSKISQFNADGEFGEKAKRFINEREIFCSKEQKYKITC